MEHINKLDGISTTDIPTNYLDYISMMATNLNTITEYYFDIEEQIPLIEEMLRYPEAYVDEAEVSAFNVACKLVLNLMKEELANGNETLSLSWPEE